MYAIRASERSLKPRNPAWTAQQIFDHSRRNAQSSGDLAFILRQSRKDRCFMLASDFGKPLRIDHHGASHRNQIGSQFDRALGIHARLDPAAGHDRAAARYDAGECRDRALCRGIDLRDRTIVNTGLSHGPAVAIIIERNGDVVEIQLCKLTAKQFAVFKRITIRLGLERRHAKPCDQLWTERVANGLRDGERKVHALCKRASPLIDRDDWPGVKKTDEPRSGWRRESRRRRNRLFGPAKPPLESLQSGFRPHRPSSPSASLLRDATMQRQKAHAEHCSPIKSGFAMRPPS